jgi:hypothetical protein
MWTWATHKDRNPLHSYSESKLDAEPKQNPPDLITRFYIDGCATLRAEALRQRIFKQKKGFVNHSLGLISHLKALPQPPSRDTVPLMTKLSICLFMSQAGYLYGIQTTQLSSHILFLNFSYLPALVTCSYPALYFSLCPEVQLHRKITFYLATEFPR